MKIPKISAATIVILPGLQHVLEFDERAKPFDVVEVDAARSVVERSY